MTWSLCDHHPGFDLPSSHGDSLVRQNFASKNQRFAEGEALFLGINDSGFDSWKQSPDDVQAKLRSWLCHNVSGIIRALLG
jgi:hypothetical protein